MVREFGPDVPKGRVYSINPALIIILVPIITAATSAVDPLIMIHYGTYVSALSVFFMAFSTSIPACVLFVITLSIGEAVWSPRLYDYTMSVAQEGREGQASIGDPQRHQGPQVVRLGTLLHQEDQQPEGGGGPPVEDLPVPGGDAVLCVEQRTLASGFGLLRDVRPH